MSIRSRSAHWYRKVLPRQGADALVEDDRRPVDEVLEEIDALSQGERSRRKPQTARRILGLRHRAGLRLVEQPVTEGAEHPAPAFDRLPSDSSLPEVSAGELTPELLRAAILRSGCLLVRQLVEPEDAARLAEGIDRAYAARDARASGRLTDADYFDEFEPDPRFDLASLREFVRGGGSGLLAADSPRVLLDVLDVFERVGLQRLATEYLGERSAMSVDKCLLRKVSPKVFGDAGETDGPKPSAWHQDGAFLGDVRALNVWLSLSRCGDEAPGLDIVPRRLDHIVATGTDGAAFDWSVSREVAEQVGDGVGILRPIFEPGDVLLFDELFLHSTAAEPEMPSMRYAVESWFFAPSRFPPEYAPLAF
jgi:hypothetical protein